jgi:hypothetical protein
MREGRDADEEALRKIRIGFGLISAVALAAFLATPDLPAL